MDIGKFPPALLERLLGKLDSADPQVILGPQPGEDAAVIDMGGRLLVAKSDPVTFATERIGWYVVQVNANDVACVGGTPRWFLLTLLVPQWFSEGEAEAVFDQAREACAALGVTLVGGHSEVTYGLERPLALGCMLGEASREGLVRTGGAQPGDSIVLTKGIAIEGCALLARDCADALAEAGVTQNIITQAKDFLDNPGISVIPDASVARGAAEIHSLHDPTEGGLATALREVARASSLGLWVDAARIPVLPECQAICRALGLNPLGLLASGALLITLAEAQAPALLAALNAKGIPAWGIGRMTDPAQGLTLRHPAGAVPLPEFPRDELARYFAERGQRQASINTTLHKM